MKSVVLNASAVIIAGASAAQSADSAGDPRAARDPHRAMWTSIATTVLPVAAGLIISTSKDEQGGSVAITGLWLGPAVGYWTNGVASRSVPGLLIRTGGLLLVGAGAIAGVTSSPVYTPIDGSSNKNSWVPGAVVAAGAALVLGSAVYDIATVDRKVREHDTALSSLTMMPIVAWNGRGAGLQVAIRF